MLLQYHTALQCTRIRNRWLVFQPVQGTQSLEKEQLQLASKLRQLEGGRPVLQKLLSSAFQCFPGFPMLFMTVMISCGQAFCSQTLSDIYSLTAKHRAWVSKQGMIRGNDIGLGSCCCGETGKQRYVDTSDLTYKLYVCFRYKSAPVPVRNIYMNCTYVNT